MVYDKICNIKQYKGLSADIYEGLKFLQQMNAGIISGTYQLSPNVKAIVSEYTTNTQNEYGYEAHCEYIDIQHLIIGEERVCCLPLEYMEETKPYNKEIDAAFYDGGSVRPQELQLGNGYFAILFPQDGHMPQLCINKPEKVKKVVIKVKLGE